MALQHRGRDCGLGGLLGSLLGRQAAGGSSAMPGAAAPGLASLLDDGNPLDDSLRLAGKAMR